MQCCSRAHDNTVEPIVNKWHKTKPTICISRYTHTPVQSRHKREGVGVVWQVHSFLYRNWNFDEHFQCFHLQKRPNIWPWHTEVIPHGLYGGTPYCTHDYFFPTIINFIITIIITSSSSSSSSSSILSSIKNAKNSKSHSHFNSKCSIFANDAHQRAN